jgi:hypothetical protein
MKTFTVLAITAALVTVPQAPAAAACTWSVTTLPVPSGFSDAIATEHAGTGLIVGTAWKTDHREGVLWRNGVPQVLPKPPVSSTGSNYPRAVNGSGVIAGYWAGNDGFTAAWRFSGGSYQFLPGIGDQVSVPTAINSGGDIVGFSRLFFGGAPVTAVMWRVDRPSEIISFGSGYVSGVDSTRRVVLSTGVIVNPDGSQVTLQGGGSPVVYQDGRIVGYRGTAAPFTIVEWNLSGQVVREIAGGVPRGVNTFGVIVGTHDSGNKAVWRNGGVEFVTSPPPAGSYVLDITDDNVIISDFDTSNGSRSGLWRSTC